MGDPKSGLYLAQLLRKSWLFHQEENRESSQVQGRRSPLPPRPHGAAPGGAGGGHRRIGPRGGPHSFCSVGGRSCRSILASGGRLRERRRTTPLALLQQRRGAGVIFRDPTERASASNSARGRFGVGNLNFPQCRRRRRAHPVAGVSSSGKTVLREAHLNPARRLSHSRPRASTRPRRNAPGDGRGRTSHFAQ
jgi:hypothetical protein